MRAYSRPRKGRQRPLEVGDLSQSVSRGEPTTERSWFAEGEIAYWLRQVEWGTPGDDVGRQVVVWDAVRSG